MKVRAGSRYVYNPVGMDAWSPANQGLKPGDVVTVVKLPGCPPPNTMGHAHVNGSDGRFGGLVLCNSLTPYRKGKENANV